MPGQVNAGWVMSITEVTQERRRQEQVQAQERLAALGRMAAGIAHDFNNILQGIIGFADIVAKQPELNKATQRRVEESAKRATEAPTSCAKSWISAASRRPTFSPSPWSRSYPISRIYGEACCRRTVDLAVEIDDVPCLVEADASQLGHVFTNLVVNGIEAMPEGGTLTVRLRRSSCSPANRPPLRKCLPVDWVAISISDTGCGIAANDLPRVFEPFFTTKRTGRSAGLGLARAYGIIQQHGGFVSLDSQVA